MELEILVRFLLAATWGGIVGAEREYRSKSAGFRTMIMIAIGSCLFTMMSVYIPGTTPDRIASNIVTGIGFLGAGVIFRGDNKINGITTAATIWAVAAVGMGIGLGAYATTACAGIFILIVLTVLPYLERMIDRINQLKVYTITCTFTEDAAPLIRELLEQHGLRFELINQSKQQEDHIMTWKTQGHARLHDRFITDILKKEWIRQFSY